MSQFCGRNESVSVLVENLERLFDLIFAIGVLHLPGHHGQELGEVNITVAVSIDFVDHVLKLGFGRVLTKRPHNSPKLLGGDRSIAILVEEGKGLLELGDLLLGKGLGCVLVGIHVCFLSNCPPSETLDRLSRLIGNGLIINLAHLEILTQNLKRIAAPLWETVFVHSDVFIAVDNGVIHNDSKFGLIELSQESVANLGGCGVFTVLDDPLILQIDGSHRNFGIAEVFFAVLLDLDVSPTQKLLHKIGSWDELGHFHSH
mmetsp:Transcript_2883/g.5327  ORF Transcript_2883/g.5327 Transcript_2883/m.5327 type:complete len:259 (+) Transcript_2883:596-1372(+)